MRGADNKTVPFMTGSAYVFSAALIKAILDDLPDTVWWDTYGTRRSEEKVAGQWYEHAKSRRTDLHFSLEEHPDLAERTEAPPG